MAKYRKNRKHKNKSGEGRYNILEALFQDFFSHSCTVEQSDFCKGDQSCRNEIY